MQVGSLTWVGGIRLSNTWSICPGDAYNLGKLRLIRDRCPMLEGLGVEMAGELEPVRSRMRLRRIMVVGGVMAHQADNP